VSEVSGTRDPGCGREVKGRVAVSFELKPNTYSDSDAAP
jgi:hypothetical protein